MECIYSGILMTLLNPSHPKFAKINLLQVTIFIDPQLRDATVDPARKLNNQHNGE